METHELNHQAARSDGEPAPEFSWRPQTPEELDRQRSVRKGSPKFAQLPQTDPDQSDRLDTTYSPGLTRELSHGSSHSRTGSGGIFRNLGLPTKEPKHKLLQTMFRESSVRDRSADAKTTSSTRSIRDIGLWRFLFRYWILEFSTWVLATVALIAIVCLLARFDDKPIGEWHSAISINTFVSILAQAAVSALLLPISTSISQTKWIWLKDQGRLVDLESFDLASRGPEGSVRFLFNRHRLW